MTAISISGAGLAGTVRLTWVRDDLAHVLGHASTDETSGTWMGLACSDHKMTVGADVDPAVLRQLSDENLLADLTWYAPADVTAVHGQAFAAAIQAWNRGETSAAERHWGNVQAAWSSAWSLNSASLEFLQGAGLDAFGPGKPQRWVVASFEHHSGPHGMSRPHIHNIVIPSLTR